MKQLVLSVLASLLCSTGFALNQQTTHEIREDQTWVTITMDASKAGSKSDVLFVIDNSGSMGQFQQNLAQQAALIANELSFYNDLNAAVINTSGKMFGGSTGEGKFVGPVLNSLNTDFAAGLSKQFMVGMDGDATEVFFDNIVLATSEPLISGLNAGFLRPDSDMLLVFVTDTEDQSANITAQGLWTHLKGLKPNNAVNVISVTPMSAQCLGESELNDKTGIKDFVTLSQGQSFDLCGDYSKELPKVIGTIKKKLSHIQLNVFANTQVDYKSLTVKADGKDLAIGDAINGWTYDTSKSKVILGSNVLSSDSIQQITVSYKLLPL